MLLQVKRNLRGDPVGASDEGHKGSKALSFCRFHPTPKGQRPKRSLAEAATCYSLWIGTPLERLLPII